MAGDGERRSEILETAASLFASSGLRTSLNEIASACGILPGSLYHHFDSKEAIVIELVQRYQDDLGVVAKDAVNALSEHDTRPVDERIVELGRAIASCAVRHRAAVLLTVYEPPTVLGDELAQLARATPTAIHAAMLEILRRGRAADQVRAGIDLELLADRLCQSMLHVGVGVSHLSPGAEHVPELRCRILLDGLAAGPRTNASLDRSPAFRAAQDAIERWNDESDDDDRAAHLRAVARAEFGKRGYETTTMRDIATAAKLSTGSVYRLFGSKDELLVSIMTSYVAKVRAAWSAVSASNASPIEQLDALMWVDINVIDHFADEFKIQLAWLRQSPPSSTDLGASFQRQLREIKSVLAAGTRAGELHLAGSSADVRARCVLEAVWVPDNIVRAAGVRGTLAHMRDTVLRGALTKPASARPRR